MSLLTRFEREYEGVRRFVWFRPAAWGASVLLAALVAGAVLLADGRWLSLPRVVPFALWGALIGGAIIAWRRARARVAHAAARVVHAAAVEEELGLREAQLRVILELPDAGSWTTRALERVAGRVPAADAPLAARRVRAVRAGAFRAAAGVVGLAVIAFASGTRVRDGWRAVANPIAAWRGTLGGAPTIVASPASVRRGTAAVVRVRASGRRSVTLRTLAVGAGWRTTTLPLNGNDTVSFVLESVTSAVRMVATDGRATSDTAVIDAVDRPFLGEVVATIRFPSYLDRADERVDATAPLRVPRGATLSVHGQATVPLARVLLRGAGAPITFVPSGTGFDGALPAVDGSYVWEVTARGGGAVDVPAPLRIETIPDSAPDLELVAPSRDSVVSAQGEVPILVAAHDDHALASVALRVWKVGVAGATTPTETRIGAPQGSDYAGGATLRLEAFALQPGDALHVLPVARDASPWRQEGRGRELVLRLPSVNEEREIARALADSAVQRATDAARAQQGLQRRTQEEARARTPRDARPNDAQLKFGDAERAKALAAEQRTMQQRTEQLQKQVQSVQDHLKGAGALDSSLARQLGEAQRMLKEAMTPELRAALEQAEKAGDQLDATRSKQSMAELAAQQQRMKEALERSAEMLKRAALEGAMSTVRDAARDLAKAQAAAADSAERGMGTDASRRAQAARTEALARDAEQLRKRLSQARADTAARAADLAARQARRAAEALKDSTGGAARSREAAKQLEAAAQSLQTGREAQVGAWKEEVTDDLDRAVQEMMQMAREQDLLAAESKQTRSSTGMQAKQGALKQGAESSMQRVERTSRKSAMLSPKTQRAMQDAQSKLDQATRDAGQSGGGKEGGITSMQEAAEALRQAAAALARDRERAAAAGSASGVPEMLAQLQQAADQQAGVNSQMQSLLQMAAQAGKAGGPSEAAARQAARDAAKAQREVARALDDAADADATGKAEALAREARQVAQTLEQGASDPGVLARQQRLLRRMLDAGRVLEQEDQKEDGKREAKSGAGIAPFAPTRGAARGAAAERYAAPDWNALRSLDAADRRVVLEYFRRLNGTTP